MRAACVLVLVVLAVGAARADEVAEWRLLGETHVENGRATFGKLADARAKNVILFVGDGMGIATVTAARIFEGQRNGATGEEHALSFEHFAHVALSKTYNTNQQTPDSAGTMTAMVTGVKTRAGVLSVGPSVARGDAEGARTAELETLLEAAEDRGLATGIVTTASITHATPAAGYAHSPERDWEDDAKLDAAARAADYPDIARQLVEFDHGDGLEVALGGGRRSFLPRELPDPEYGTAEPARFGRRTDGRNLAVEWSARESAHWIWNARQLDDIDLTGTRHLLGLFEPSHMRFEADREKDPGSEPTLAEMTSVAIRLLGNHPAGRTKGWVLIVEAGRIDHAHHYGNAARALIDTLALSDAVTRAVAESDPGETLIVVTADHSHTLTFAGYPTRGNPILGLVRNNDDTGAPEAEPARDKAGLPYTTLGYANGLGAQFESRRDLSEVDTTALDFQQDAAIPTRIETHSGEDVPVYATGPGAVLVYGVMEQSDLYHVMVHALGWQRPDRGFLGFWRRLFGG